MKNTERGTIFNLLQHTNKLQLHPEYLPSPTAAKI